MLRTILAVITLASTTSAAYGQVQQELLRNPDGSWSHSWTYLPEIKARTTFSVYVTTATYTEQDQFRISPIRTTNKTSEYYLMNSQLRSWQKNLQEEAKKKKLVFEKFEDNKVYYIEQDILDAKDRLKEKEKYDLEEQRKQQEKIKQEQDAANKKQQDERLALQRRMQEEQNAIQRQQVPPPVYMPPQPQQYIPPTYQAPQPKYVPPPQPQVVEKNQQSQTVESDGWENYKNGSIVVGIISLILLGLIAIINKLKE